MAKLLTWNPPFCNEIAIAGRLARGRLDMGQIEERLDGLFYLSESGIQSANCTFLLDRPIPKFVYRQGRNERADDDEIDFHR